MTDELKHDDLAAAPIEEQDPNVQYIEMDEDADFETTMVTMYLEGRLAERARNEVEERLMLDGAFARKVAPLILAWADPVAGNPARGRVVADQIHERLKGERERGETPVDPGFTPDGTWEVTAQEVEERWQEYEEARAEYDRELAALRLEAMEEQNEIRAAFLRNRITELEGMADEPLLVLGRPAARRRAHRPPMIQ